MILLPKTGAYFDTTSAFGEVVYAPPGFTYPQPKEYAKGLTESLYQTVETNFYDTLTPPLQQHTAAMKTAVQAATNAVDLYGLLTKDSATLAQKAGAVLNFVVGLLNDAAAIIEMITDVTKASLAAANALASAAQTAAALGPFVEAVAGFVTQYLQGLADAARADVEVEDCLREHLSGYCKTILNSHLPQPTGGRLTVSPADLFRRVAWSYQTGQPAPMNAGSMYVLLCGAETQGYGMTRKRYGEVLAAARKKDVKGKEQGNAPVGIPPHTQRVMWTLVKGMMSSVAPPGFSKSPLIGDSGRSIMPILQDILLTEYLAGRVTWSFLQRLGRELAKPYHITTTYDGIDCLGRRGVHYHTKCVPAGSFAVCYSRSGNCSEHGIGSSVGTVLANSIERGILSWHLDIRNTWQPDGKNWLMGPGGKLPPSALTKDIRIRAPQLTVVTNAERMIDAGKRYQEREGQEPVTAARLAMVPWWFLGTAAASTAVYFGANQLGKAARRNR